MYAVIVGIKGKEFLQKANTCHKVAKGKGKKIAEILNKLNYKINSEEIWVDTVVGYSLAKDYAEFQEFTLRNGKLKERIL